MFLNARIISSIRICFYLILVGVCFVSWIKLSKEPTAFEEKVVYNQARLPSFTFCPAQGNDFNGNRSIENFEDIEKEIEHVRHKYTIGYDEFKPYEQDKKVDTMYDDTEYGTWYFAPQISTSPPYEIVICLIWTPSRKHKIKPDWRIEVSQLFEQKVSIN